MRLWHVLLITLLVVGCAKQMTLDEAKAKCAGSTDPHCWRDAGEKFLNADMCDPKLYPSGREEAGAKCAQGIAEKIGDDGLCRHPALVNNPGSDVSVDTCLKAVAGKKQKCGVTGMPCCHPRKCLDDADYCDNYYRCTSKKVDESDLPPGSRAVSGSII